MPRYFFDTDDGEQTRRDCSGVVLPDLHAAKVQAFHLLHDLSHGLAVEGSLVRSCAIRENDQEPVYRVTMVVEGRTIAAGLSGHSAP